MERFRRTEELLSQKASDILPGSGFPNPRFEEHFSVTKFAYGDHNKYMIFILKLWDSDYVGFDPYRNGSVRIHYKPGGRLVQERLSLWSFPLLIPQKRHHKRWFDITEAHTFLHSPDANELRHPTIETTKINEENVGKMLELIGYGMQTKYDHFLHS